LASKVPSWLERVLLPQVNELKGEIKTLDAKVEGEFKAVHSEMKRLDEKIGGLDKRMDMTQRVAVIEEKMREIESKR